jgi:hypothetical protein
LALAKSSLRTRGSIESGRAALSPALCARRWSQLGPALFAGTTGGGSVSGGATVAEAA